MWLKVFLLFISYSLSGVAVGFVFLSPARFISCEKALIAFAQSRITGQAAIELFEPRVILDPPKLASILSSFSPQFRIDAVTSVYKLDGVDENTPLLWELIDHLRHSQVFEDMKFIPLRDSVSLKVGNGLYLGGYRGATRIKHLYEKKIRLPSSEIDFLNRYILESRKKEGLPSLALIPSHPDTVPSSHLKSNSWLRLALHEFHHHLILRFIEVWVESNLGLIQLNLKADDLFLRPEYVKVENGLAYLDFRFVEFILETLAARMMAELHYVLSEMKSSEWMSVNEAMPYFADELAMTYLRGQRELPRYIPAFGTKFKLNMANLLTAGLYFRIQMQQTIGRYFQHLSKMRDQLGWNGLFE